MKPKVEPQTYPQYYNVDDVPVVLEEDGDYVVGKVANGRPYPIGKAMVDGYQITKEEYTRLAKQLYDINIP
jgi:hypothetical protein